MNRTLLQFVSITAAVSVCLTTVNADDSDKTNKVDYGIPGLCPLWPIEQMGPNEYLYYAEYHPGTSCGNQSSAYLQGLYSWPIDCATQKHLCAFTGYRSSSPFTGLGYRVLETWKPEDTMPGQAAQHGNGDPNGGKMKLRLMNSNGTTVDYYVIAWRTLIRVQQAGPPAQIHYGFQSRNFSDGIDVASGNWGYVDKFGQPSGTSTKVIRARIGVTGQDYLVFLE